MADRRIILTLSAPLLRFLDQMSTEIGMDRSNLIRMKLWEWMSEEKDRALREREAARKPKK